ncbi:MAG: tRNA (N(6)-L-threonylcarbamoyladenosine(37)-C(2))-methylthiotransferase MtaB [Dehalococcoidia bacterium]|nr:tRNA (N(6)-L-threonylcarbamoyladenosine(37)-C(2))-methylthiotransferase MtaB [Dehalococcoidia bacterium]
MKVAFYTLGCKLNQAETESLAHRFSRAGLQVVSPDDGVDVYIANTCTVTHVADRKSRHWLRLARRANPHALIIATGCYVQRSPKDLTRLADLLVDNREKEHLPDLVRALYSEQTGSDQSEAGQSQVATPGLRTRSMVKVQDGCHSACAYCIVPKVRPREYSLPASTIIEQVRQKVALGYREVVLTGTKVGSYRDSVHGLKDLLERILTETDIKRLHLSSLQPTEISPELLALWQDDRLCRHFHLALQIGSQAMLERMTRSYSLEQYRAALDLIRDTAPGTAITTDIMVGFPGETDDEFEQSYSVCRQAGFASIHVFPFSPRPGTAASAMPGQVEERVKQERTRRMLELSRQSRRRFHQQFVGQTMPVLWEKETAPGSGIYSGLTGNYIRVYARSKGPLSNRITPARLTGFHTPGMRAEVLSEGPD